MNAHTHWLPAEPDLETVCQTYSDPIYALSPSRSARYHSPKCLFTVSMRWTHPAVHKYGFDA